jgi:acetylornithine deacetylase
LIEEVRSYLKSHGVDCQLLVSRDKAKANLIATVGPAVPGGVVLSGHTDVVPVDGQPWATPPFRLVEAGGRLYGRGTADMKGYLAAVLTLVPTMVRANLARPLHIAMSYDEEVGCLGAPELIERLLVDLPRPSAVVVGEPTDMDAGVAHKGAHLFQTTVTSVDCHSSLAHDAVNAVVGAARLIVFLEEFGVRLAQNVDADFGGNAPFSTLSVNLIEGGSAINTVPGRCSFSWDLRNVPSTDHEQVLTALQEFVQRNLLPQLLMVNPATRIETRRLVSIPPLRPETSGAAEAVVRNAQSLAVSRTVSFATEAGMFQRAGLSTVVCGPGSVFQAHQPNEYVETAQIERCLTMLHGIVSQMTT